MWENWPSSAELSDAFQTLVAKAIQSRFIRLALCFNLMLNAPESARMVAGAERPG
jgi:hypothetical protein